MAGQPVVAAGGPLLRAGRPSRQEVTQPSRSSRSRIGWIVPGGSPSVPTAGARTTRVAGRAAGPAAPAASVNVIRKLTLYSATRLRQGGADPAQVQALLGHVSLDTSARYFRAGTAETAAVIEPTFDR